jgi:hypothetical protein
VVNSMRYLTYEEYLQIGGTVDSSTFNRNISRACGIIDNATFGRIKNHMATVPENAKHLCRDLIECIARNNVTDLTVTSKSQSAGAVSESESYAVKTADDVKAEITGIVYDYLASVYDDNGTPVLYRGCRK